MLHKSYTSIGDQCPDHDDDGIQGALCYESTKVLNPHGTHTHIQTYYYNPPFLHLLHVLTR